MAPWARLYHKTEAFIKVSQPMDTTVRQSSIENTVNRVLPFNGEYEGESVLSDDFLRRRVCHAGGRRVADLRHLIAGLEADTRRGAAGRHLREQTPS